MSDIEELRALVNALHSRGIREKGLQRQIQKYLEIIPQVCTKHKEGECLHLFMAIDVFKRPYKYIFFFIRCSLIPVTLPI